MESPAPEIPERLPERSLDLLLPDPAAAAALGAAIAALLRPGDAVLLDGPLGAGKSTLARALLRAACRDPALEVPSPSYTLVQLYDGFDAAGAALPVAHLDLWRLDGPDAVVELGWDELLAGAVVVEWPDRLGALAPAEALRIGLQPTDVAPEDGAGDDPAVDDGAAPRRAVLRGWPDRLDSLGTGR